MGFLQVTGVLALIGCLAAGAPNLQRGSRSLEDVPYLPPEPYLPPLEQPASLNSIPLNTKDYLPPDEAPTHVALNNGESRASAKAVGDIVEVYASIGGTDESSASPVKNEEPEGYFYPRPSQGFDLPNEQSDRTERTISNEDVAETTPANVENYDRDVRSPQTSLLRSNPEDGPVRISTQPFTLTRVQEEKNLKERRSDEKKAKPFTSKGQSTAQALPATGVSSKARRNAEREVLFQRPVGSSTKLRRQTDNKWQTKPAPPRGQLTAQTLPARTPPKKFPQ